MGNIFKIGSIDYSSRVVDASYNINAIPQYKDWSDGYGNRHRDQRGFKREGSVQLVFKTMNEYNTFLTDLNTAKYNAENQYNITIKSNNNAPNTAVSIHAFLDFEPIRALKGDMSEYIQPFEISIMES